MRLLRSLNNIKVGDEVLILKDNAFRGSFIRPNWIGKVGVVKAILAGDENPYVVEFDTILTGFRGVVRQLPLLNCKSGYSRQFSLDEVRPVAKAQPKKNVKTQHIKVRTEGDTVCVSVYDQHGVREGRAVCHEDDEFDYFTGLQIALARALGETIPLVSNSEVNEVALIDRIQSKDIINEVVIRRGKDRFRFPVVIQ